MTNTPFIYEPSMYIEPLSFLQLFGLVAFVAIVLGGLVWYVLKKPVTLSHKNSSIQVGSDESLTITPDQATGVFLILEVNKTNKTLTIAQNYGANKQDKLIVDVLDNLEKYLVFSYRKLYGNIKRNRNQEFNDIEILSDKSYLMFQMIVEKLRNALYSAIKSDLNEIHLSFPIDPVTYTNERGIIQFELLKQIFASLYYEIGIVPREAYLEHIELKASDIVARLKNLYNEALQVQKQINEHFEKVEEELNTKIARAYNIEIGTVYRIMKESNHVRL